VRLIVVPLHDLRKCRHEGWRTRDAHLLQHLLRRPEVERILVVDRPMNVPELVATRRFGYADIGSIVERSLRHRVFADGKLVVLDYLSTAFVGPTFLAKGWFPHAYAARDFQALLRGVIERLGFAQAVLFLMTPHGASLADLRPWPLVAFDCDDNLLVHPEISARRKAVIAVSMRRIAETADVFFANSAETAAYYRSWCRKTAPVFISNGADPGRFGPDGGTPPEDVRAIGKPIIGYAGMLGKRIDVDLIGKVADAYPGHAVVLIGPILDRAWMRPLLAHRGVYYLGDKHYDVYPRYVRSFDVAMIPHHVGPLENSGDPTKLYEYLAAGRPVVATPIAGVQRYADRIHIATTHDAFLDGIAVALREGGRGDSRLRVEDTWERKVETMMQTLEEHVRAR
jgi:glycosyltransferase involved in cell wall biosynthesis